MKKTLVAVAALATFGTAAFAQSSVTLYGKIDWTLQNRTEKTGGVKTANGNRGFEVNSAGLSGSRWGMKGTEDLGGGLNAIFQLESGFSVDDARIAQGGAQSTNLGTGVVTQGNGILFGRQAYAGLSGGFGQFTVGRQYSPLDNAWSNYDAQGQATNSALTYAFNKGIHGDPARIDNSMYYKTPAMGGFVAEVMFAPQENKTPTTNRDAGNLLSVAAGYMNGPLGVNVVYEKVKSTTGLPLAGSTSVRDWTVGAQYDFGVAKLYGQYERATNSASQDDKGWHIGTAIPFGAFQFILGYARETSDLNTAVDGKTSAVGATLVYSLSKRTNVYADLLNGKTRAAGAVVGPTTKNTIVGVGMRHDF